MQLAYALHKSIIRNPKFPKVLLVNRNLKIENQKNLTSVYYLTRGVSSTRVLLDTRVLVDLLLVCYSNLHVERVVADNRYSTVTTRVDRRVMKSQFLAISRQIFKIFGYFPPNFRIFSYVLPKYRNF